MISVLYIVDEAYPTTSANGRIVYRIIDELIKHPDISITILARAKKQEQWAITDYNGCKIIHAPGILATKAEKLNKKLGKRKWLRFFMMPRTIYYRLSGENDYYKAELTRWIRQHINEFDVIVANSMPFYPLDIASKFGDEKPVILYKMELVAHYVQHGNFEAGRIIEEQWDNKAAAIIMEDLIYKFYKQYASDENLRKVVVTKFPCVIKRDIAASERRMLQNDICNLVYVGKFYYKKRDPRYLFSIMEKLRDKKIHLTIAGGYQYTCLPKDFIETYFTNKIPYITYLGELPAQQADALLNEADILVHLGNKVPDQMPSKILDYISSGKPILNIHGLDDCPTLPYLKKYNLQMSIKDGAELTDELIEQVERFCVENKGKRIAFDKIQKDFENCTPEYVGRQFYETIERIVKQNLNM